MDGLGGGVVFWNPGNVYVSKNGGSIQRGVDAVPSDGIVNVEWGGHYQDFYVGTRLVTVSLTGEIDPWGGDLVWSMTQQADSLDPAQRTLVVWGGGGRDIIDFAPGLSAGEVQVRINNLPKGTFLPTGPSSPTVTQVTTTSRWLTASCYPLGWTATRGTTGSRGGQGHDVLIGDYGDDLLGGRRRP